MGTSGAWGRCSGLRNSARVAGVRGARGPAVRAVRAADNSPWWTKRSAGTSEQFPAAALFRARRGVGDASEGEPQCLLEGGLEPAWDGLEKEGTLA